MSSASPAISSRCRCALWRRTRPSPLSWVLASTVLGCAALSGPSWTFAPGAASATARPHGLLRAEPESAPAPAPAPAGGSVALVKVTEESKMTTASLLGGIAGLLLGGVWVGGAAFAAASYLSRKEDSDVSKALKGIAGGGLEVLNFGAQLNDKYTVTNKLGDAIQSAVEGAKANPDSKDTANAVLSFFDGIANTVSSLDKDIGIKDTIGNLAVSASDLSFQAVEKVVELNKEYKVTDQITAKVEETINKSAK